MAEKKSPREMKLVEVDSTAAWRRWLKKNGERETCIWLVYFKPGAPKTGIDYESSVQEALCFGWIDSTVRRIDEHRYVRQFTPRNKKSNWSIPNRKRVHKLLEEGRMTEAGLALLPDDIHDHERIKPKPKPPLVIPDDLIKALARNKAAREKFEKLAPSAKRMYVQWINAARQDVTRKRRIAETIRLTIAGIRGIL